MSRRPDSDPDLSDFKCLNCGACCRQSGYVRLLKNEPDIIAAYLSMDVRSFIDKFTILTRDRQALSLKDKENGECIFLSSKGCNIHPVKPQQCREFPWKWKFSDFNQVCQWARAKARKKTSAHPKKTD